MDRLKMETECLALALGAGEAILGYYGGSALDVAAKADESPVTAADLAADRLIRAGLVAAFPEIPAVTEEEADSHGREPGARFFLVDPLDGTKDFVQGRADFTVNIALIEDGVPTFGVVYAPARGRVFWTPSTGGAAQAAVTDHAAGPASPIAVRSADPAALTVVASKSHRDAATDAYIARYPVGAFEAAGSSLKFCLVAAGEADLYPRLGRTMEWDTAAGDAVLRGAGGHVVRADDLTPLRYGKPGYENPHFLAHSPTVSVFATA